MFTHVLLNIIENIVAKGQAPNDQFLLSPHCFRRSSAANASVTEKWLIDLEKSIVNIERWVTNLEKVDIYILLSVNYYSFPTKKKVVVCSKMCYPPLNSGWFNIGWHCLSVLLSFLFCSKQVLSVNGFYQHRFQYAPCMVYFPCSKAYI